MQLLLLLMAIVGLLGLASATPTAAEVLEVLKGRAPSNKNGLICCDHTAQPWTYVQTQWVFADIAALKERGGTCGVNGRTCVQIACTEWTEIVLCNDNDYRIEPSCAYLASYAEDIIWACKYYDFYQVAFRTCGQQFDSDHYNIIVKQTPAGIGCPA